MIYPFNDIFLKLLQLLHIHGGWFPWLHLLSIGCKVRSEADEDAKTDIDFVIEGEFSVSNEMSDEAFTKMLMVNGVSALYGIARSKLEVITALTYHQGKISFPMINVLELLKEKQEQESQKN